METITLRNGVEMPILGYGVYQIPPAETARCVRQALETGYRSIDTAQIYGNEAEVGQAVEQSGLKRGDVFITTKIWISNAGEEAAERSLGQSLERLRTDYADLVLVHQPFGDYYGTWRALERAYRDGRARAIGVSNFYSDRLIDLASFVEIPPMVNQMETHPFNQQVRAQQIFSRYGCATMAWAPLAEGRNGLFTNSVLTRIGQQYGKTPAQVALRWLTQRQIIAIPKTTRPERMAENFHIFDFTLSEQDMKEIAALDLRGSLWFHHQDPDTAEMFVKMTKDER